MSPRRRAELKARKACREEVLARAGYRCEYASIIPEVECGWLPDRYDLEVDELRGGSFRCTEYLDADSCVAACPVHHDWKSANKNKVIDRVRASGLDRKIA